MFFSRWYLKRGSKIRDGDNCIKGPNATRFRIFDVDWISYRCQIGAKIDDTLGQFGKICKVKGEGLSRIVKVSRDAYPVWQTPIEGG